MVIPLEEKDVSYNCPHCLTEKSGFKFFARKELSKEYDNGMQRNLTLFVYTCRNCLDAICIKYDTHVFPEKLHLQGMNCIKIYPEPKDFQAPLGTPEDVAVHFVKGEKHSLKSDMSDESVIMIRKALETYVNKNNPKGKTLFHKIAHLFDDEIITQEIYDWCIHIKDSENDGAHGTTNQSQAKELVEFARAFFTYIYTIPHLIHEGRKNEEPI